MNNNIIDGDFYQNNEIKSKSTFPISLKGGKGKNQVDSYSKLNDEYGDTSNSKLIRDKEDKNFKLAMENSKLENLKPKFQAKIDKTVKRSNQIPYIGMANLGNTCYFNSIMQILFFSDCFSKKICKFNAKIEAISIKQSKEDLSKEQENKLKMKKKYLENGIVLINEIQIMFGRMIKGKINYANPQGVLDHLMEKMNNRKVEVGLQKDLVEFLGIFFECIEAGYSQDQKVDKFFNQ